MASKMVYIRQRKKRENFLSSMNEFTRFMSEKGIALDDREYLLYKKFLWKKKQIEETPNWIEIMLGYIFTNFKPKTIFVCDHITACLVRHKASKILSHNCGFETSLHVVSEFELKSSIYNYLDVDFDRIVVCAGCSSNSESTLRANEIIYITRN